MSSGKVAILMGSASDADTVLRARDILNSFGVESEVHVMSAHRTPKAVCEFAERAEENGFSVIIAAAGVAAHLAGVVAAHTLLPVIGLPMPGGVMDGLDALLATVQMPKGTPVATVAVGSHGAVNAGLLAVRILALSDEGLKAKLKQFVKDQQAEMNKADLELQAKLKS